MNELRPRLEAEARRGDIATFDHEGTPSVVLSHPRLFKHVLVDAAAAYGKTQKERPLFGSGLLLSEGEQWAAQRRAATRMFVDDAVHHKQVLADALIELLDGWRVSGHVDVSPAIQRYMLRNLSASLFNIDLSDHATAFSEAVQTLIRVNSHDPVSVQRVLALRDLVARQCDLPPFFDNRDQIATFLLAGTETSANTLTWAMHLLARAPRALEAVRLRGEAAAIAVVNEALRLYPPLWIITREVRQRDVVDGVVLEPGTQVYLFVLRVQRDPRFWPDAAAFRPDRFEAGSPEPFSFVPFGAGARVCVGRRFAMAELTAAVQGVARSFTLDVVAGQPDPEEAAHFTLCPDGPVIVSFTPIDSVQPAAL